MSMFSKALEQADHDRALREQASQREHPTPVASPPPMGQSTDSPDVHPRADEPLIHPPPEAVPRSRIEATGGIDEHLVSLLAPTSHESEQYRILRHLVEQMHKNAGLCVLGITSAAAGDGKTTTAINLAGALAQSSEARVLLLETDLRQPSVVRLLGLPHAGASGLVDAILDPLISLHDVVQLRSPFNLAVLPAGRSTMASYEVLKSPRLGELIEEARQRYDYVVLDMPPLMPFPDCRLLERSLDGFLIVAAAHKTPRKLLEDALSVVDRTKIIGLVFNGDDRPSSPYYSYYAYSQSPNGNARGWFSRVAMRLRYSMRRRSSA